MTGSGLHTGPTRSSSCGCPRTFVVDSEAAVISDRLIHPAIERGNEGFQIGALLSGAKADSRLEAGRGHSFEIVHPEVHPHPIQLILYRCRDAGLAGPGRPDQ